MAIVRLQAAEDLDLSDACSKAAILIDKNSEEFKRAIKRKALSIYNSKFITHACIKRSNK